MRPSRRKPPTLPHQAATTTIDPPPRLSNVRVLSPQFKEHVGNWLRDNLGEVLGQTQASELFILNLDPQLRARLYADPSSPFAQGHAELIALPSEEQKHQ